ncbi:Transferase [Trema orientale]|uniref:Transferase n=1 Tax=Trema orientale TaxID=63057 RepID=A0A2P5F468_TREOI|nr:Transferase [Trema orientale]
MAVVVTIKGCHMVKPAEATWRGCLSLSELDQSGAIIHLPTIHFYRQPPLSWLTPSDLITTTLKESLSRALVPFYPLAGRLRRIDGGRFELDCNALGVQFIEAESDSKLDKCLGTDLSPSPSADQYRHLRPTIDYNVPIEVRPVTIVQLTRFACGGIALSLSISHAVIDAQSMANFLSEWAGLARGEACVRTRVPCHDRSVLGAGQPPAGLAASNYDHTAEFNQLLVLAESTKKNAKKASTLSLSKEQMEILKATANEYRDSTTRAYTRYEALTGHIWRCACLARKHETEQPTGLAIYVDVRNRLQPPLPSGYFGNTAIGVTATSTAGALMSKPLGFAASRVRGAIDKVTNEYIWSYIDHLKNQSDLTKLQDLFIYGNPNMGVASWTRLPIYGIDFGWGKEVYTGPGSQRIDGDVVILSSSTGDGSLLVAVCLEAIYMDSFEKHFYDMIS